jgi:roadblock/LC7 domain-containing protein
VADDLDRWQRGEPILARRAGAWERAAKWARRRPAAAALVAVSGIAALTLVGLGVALSYQSRLTALHRYAESQRDRAETALAKELNFLYQNRLIFADRVFEDNNPHRALELLGECPEYLRNWEWHHLKRQCQAERLSFRAHEGRAMSAAFSPDGQLIATGGGDHTIRLFESGTGRGIWESSGRQGDFCFVEFSPDGTRLVSVDGEVQDHGRVIIHEVATGRALLTIAAETGQTASASFSPDGRLLATSDQSGMIKIWDGTPETGGPK